MNEPKRRGRPPKVKPEPNARVEGAALPVGCAECGQAVGHYDDCGTGMGVMTVKDQSAMAYVASPCKCGAGTMGDCVANNCLVVQARAYANRVWNGQSPDVPRHERLERVKRALDGQGLSMEGVVL
jgi:hypothetical protein